MIKNFCFILSLSLSFTFSIIAQNASDYFPSAPGFKWYYKTVPHDSLNFPLDSLSYVIVDSFTVNQPYLDKPANIIISNNQQGGSTPKISDSDTNYVSLDSSNIWTYMSAFPGTDTIDIGVFNSFKGWFSVYRLSQPTNISYTIYTKDSIFNYNGINTTLTHLVTAKRFPDQNISTAVGDMMCKMFILNYTIKAKVSVLSFSVVTIYDTVYIAPGNYIVRDVRPSAIIDLSFLGQGAFYISGSSMEIQAPPPVLSVNPENISPNNYSLFQNYPNPFNPATTIKYFLSYESYVKIIVHNSIGQVVRELVSEVQLSGTHELRFSSSSLSSGMYFYSLYVNSVDGKQIFSNTKKMIILK
ncbi:MAG: T9SS type A sorting domain-containing protein [Ignavibacteriaceae bacterium]|nr:T9SS type A sorting domain-containing protein [Ignavibacteriaceae bacterium]